jgi:hypothetical protein
VSATERRGAWTLVSSDDDVHFDAQLTGWVEHSRLTELQGGIGFSGNKRREPPVGPGRSGFSRGTRRRATEIREEMSGDAAERTEAGEDRVTDGRPVSSR